MMTLIIAVRRKVEVVQGLYPGRGIDDRTSQLPSMSELFM